VLQQRPNTFAQTILSLSFFACDKAADHTFRLADIRELVAQSEFVSQRELHHARLGQQARVGSETVRRLGK